MQHAYCVKKNQKTREHFILECSALADIRTTVIADITEILLRDFNIDFDALQSDTKLQIILDCKFLVKKFHHIGKLEQLEFHARRLLHNFTLCQIQNDITIQSKVEGNWWSQRILSKTK